MTDNSFLRSFRSIGDIFKPPFEGLWLVAVLYFFWTYLVFPHSPVLRGEFPDTDDYMYLTQVLDWMNGQGWYDNIQHRLDPPAGVPIHFSRLVMLPMAAIIKLIEWMGLGPKGSATIMAVIYPVVLLGILFIVLRWVAKCFMPKEWAGCTAFVGLFATSTLGLFQPGHVDHHNLVVILIAVALGCAAHMMLRPGEYRWPFFAGIVMAFAMVTALEVLPWLLLLSAYLGLWAMVKAGNAARGGFLYSMALFVGSVLGLLATRPPSDLMNPDVLTYSITYVVLAGGIVVSFAGVYLVDIFLKIRNFRNSQKQASFRRRPESSASLSSGALDGKHQNATRGKLWYMWNFAALRQVRFENALDSGFRRNDAESVALVDQVGLLSARTLRFIIGLFLAVISAVWFLHAFPELKAGPYGGIDPALVHIILDEVNEAQPMKDGTVSWLDVFWVTASCFLALPVSLWFFKQARGVERWLWGLQLLLLTAAAGMSFLYQRRYVGTMNMLEVVPLAVLLQRGWEWVGSNFRGRKQFFAELGLILLVGPLPAVLLPALVDNRNFNYGVFLFPVSISVGGAACETYELENVLRNPEGLGNKSRIIMNPLGVGPELLFRTNHKVLAAPFHMDVNGNVDSTRFFSTPYPDEAEAIARRRNIDLVVTCQFVENFYFQTSPFNNYTDISGPGQDFAPHFVERLVQGHIPPWLKPIKVAGLKNYLIYEVLPPAVNAQKGGEPGTPAKKNHRK